MSAQLVPLNSKAVGTVTLQRPVFLIGRHPECDVRIDLPSISRRHCCVALAYDRITLRDLGSRNGVRVNGRVVEEVVLQHGDELAIGQVIFRLHAPDNAPASPQPHSATAPPPPIPPPAVDLPLPPLTDDDDLVPLDF